MAVAQAVALLARPRASSERMLFAATIAGFVIWDFGGHIDVWYHQHYGFAIESFVTWPQALLYVGWIASAAAATAYLFESRALAPPAIGVAPSRIPARSGRSRGLRSGRRARPVVALHVRIRDQPRGPHQPISPRPDLLGGTWLLRSRVGRDRPAAPSTHPRIHGRSGRGGESRHVVPALAIYALFYSQPFATDYASGGAVTGRSSGWPGSPGGAT